MSFSNILKNLRRKCDMTQEELAEIMELTPQAVSRWENGAAVPDTATVCRLAYLFGVTTDYLLEVDSASMDDKAAEVIASADAASPEDAARMLRDALVDFPCNHDLMSALARCLYYRVARADTTDDRKSKNAMREAIRIAEFLYSRGHGDVYMLLHMYRDSGQLEKGRELLGTLGDYGTVRQEMAIELAEGGEKLRLMQENAHILLSKLSWQVYTLSLESDYFTSEQQIAMLEGMFAASRALMPDDAPYLYNSQPTHIPWQLARRYSMEGNTDEAIRWLYVMRDAAIMDESFEGERDFRLDSPAFCGLSLNRRARSWGAAWMLDVMGDDYFDNIRDDARFGAIQEELKRYTGD